METEETSKEPKETEGAKPEEPVDAVAAEKPAEKEPEVVESATTIPDDAIEVDAAAADDVAKEDVAEKKED
jgi:hypothetical protein